MRKIILISALLSLSGCAVFESSGKCYFAEKPEKYLVDEQGRFMDENGVRTAHRVLNPYYQDYLECTAG